MELAATADDARGRSRRFVLAALVVLTCGIACTAWSAETPSRQVPAPSTTLVFYWAVDCPHCQDAKPFVEGLERQYPDLAVESVEVRKDSGGRRRFLEHMSRLGVAAAGVPTFVVGERAIVGFQQGRSETELHGAIEAALGIAGASPVAPSIDLPFFGEQDPRTLSLPLFTVMIGLADGFNPCAFWVLTVMLAVLLHARSRQRLLLFGMAFVLTSGVVYFLFMTAWALMFSLAGMSALLTRALGIGLVVMGLINLKELVWFKQGPSLMIPEGAKPRLYARMRAITTASSLPAALAGILALAFVVNLIELGCTVGLPAVYTRILTLQPELGSAGRYGYLALYNLAYVVPLGVVVIVYAVAFRRISLGERSAKVLKAVSGVLLVAFGTLFLLRPEALG